MMLSWTATRSALPSPVTSPRKVPRLPYAADERKSPLVPLKRLPVERRTLTSLSPRATMSASVVSVHVAHEVAAIAVEREAVPERAVVEPRAPRRPHLDVAVAARDQVRLSVAGDVAEQRRECPGDAVRAPGLVVAEGGPGRANHADEVPAPTETRSALLSPSTSPRKVPPPPSKVLPHHCSYPANPDCAACRSHRRRPRRGRAPACWPESVARTRWCRRSARSRTWHASGVYSRTEVGRSSSSCRRRRWCSATRCRCTRRGRCRSRPRCSSPNRPARCPGPRLSRHVSVLRGPDRKVAAHHVGYQRMSLSPSRR